MSEETDSATVVVDVDETPPADEAPTTVVVTDTGSDGGNDLAIGVALGELATTVESLAATVAAQNERLDALAARAEYTEQVAEDAVEIAVDAAVTVDEVAEEAVEAAEETAADEVEELIEPVREHRIWRNPVRLRHGHDVT